MKNHLTHVCEEMAVTMEVGLSFIHAVSGVVA